MAPGEAIKVTNLSNGNISFASNANIPNIGRGQTITIEEDLVNDALIDELCILKTNNHIHYKSAEENPNPTAEDLMGAVKADEGIKAAPKKEATKKKTTKKKTTKKKRSTKVKTWPAE